MMAEQGLPGTELLVVPETELEDGRLPAAALAPVRVWLRRPGGGRRTGAPTVVRRTLTGALESLPRRVELVAGALAEQEATVAALGDDVDRAYARALDEVDEALRSGALLRGEVLGRWHEVVGHG